MLEFTVSCVDENGMFLASCTFLGFPLSLVIIKRQLDLKTVLLDGKFDLKYLVDD